jgi:hypothetical protein
MEPDEQRITAKEHQNIIILFQKKLRSFIFIAYCIADSTARFANQLSGVSTWHLW